MQVEYIFFAVFALVVAHLLWRFFRSGSLTGAMLGGRIAKEVGEISLAKGAVSSQLLRVLEMESHSGERFVGVAVVSKAPMAASMMPFKLSRAQAQELVVLLQRASGT